MKTHPARTTRPLDRSGDPALQRPPLAFDDDDGAATADWLAHIAARRIRVR